MNSEHVNEQQPIGVGAVGVSPGEHDGILRELPQDGRFRLVAFCDEGTPEPGYGEQPAEYYADYNMLLRDPDIELILVDGPVELRRDFAVRALNAGRHVVLQRPFAETALDAERVMKTALRAGLVATMDLPWRDEPDLLAVRAAVSAEDAGPLSGVMCLRRLDEDASAPEPGGALEALGFAMLDQVCVLLDDDVASVAAHAVGGTLQGGFLLYLPLRRGGWAVVQASRHLPEGMPRWVCYSARASFVAVDGQVEVNFSGRKRTYAAPETREDFWENLYAAVRTGGQLKCHPVDIVRAMKLYEAALESAESGEPVTV